MIDPKMIPDEVVEAGAKALAEEASLNWDDVPYNHDVMRGEARAAIVAALNAWPGVDCRPTFGPSRIILPVPQKEGDA